MFNLKKLPDSKVEIEVEVPADEFNLFFQQAVIEARRDLELPGFRKGMVPEKKVIETVGQDRLLFEAAELAISKHWPRVIQEANIEPIGQPEVSITKIASGNPLIFKINISVLAPFTLPDYKNLIKEILNKPIEVVVTDEEVNKAIEYVKANNKDLSPDADDEKLKEAIRQNFKFEKEQKAKEGRRVEMMEAIAKKTDVILPEIMVDVEVSKMIGELRSNLQHMGLEWDQYMSHIKKTEDDLKKEWREQAVLRAKIGIIMREIARIKKLIPSQEMVDQKVQEILRGIPEADRPKASPEAVTDYVVGRFQHEMVFDLLEKNLPQE